MIQKLTQQQLNKLVEAAASAEPYDFDDEILHTLDGDYNDDRLYATRAKLILYRYFAVYPNDNTFGIEFNGVENR